MTVVTTIAALAAQLYANITPPSPPTPAGLLTVYPNPIEAVAPGSFPTIILTLAPGFIDTWEIEALGFARHNYQIGVYCLVGPRQMEINQLHARALPWPELIMRAIVVDQTLAGKVAFMGYGDGRKWTYKMQTIPWADDYYFGISGTIPIVEKMSMPMG